MTHATAVVAWVPAVEKAPLALDLRERVQTVLSNVSGDAGGVANFFTELAARDPPIETIEDVRGMLRTEVRTAAKGVISTATLKSFAMLIDPSGFEWAEGESVRGAKRICRIK
eukprot:4696328-Prymnesium_polylepis.1